MERHAPTHVLTITVPLDLDEPLPCDVVQETLGTALDATRSALEGRICRDATVELRPAFPGTPS